MSNHAHSLIDNTECSAVCLALLCPSREQESAVINNLMEVTVSGKGVEREACCAQLK